MSSLEDILDSPTVEIFESTAELAPEAFERRRQTVAERENRAVSGVVRDDRGRLLLARYEGEGRWGSWRLPGSKVGNVTDFESRLREHAVELLGDHVAGVDPTQVQKHTAKLAGGEGDGTGGNVEDASDFEGTSLFYVLCDVELDGRPTEIVERASTPESVELQWFAEKPDDVINEGVLTRLFGEEGPTE